MNNTTEATVQYPVFTGTWYLAADIPNLILLSLIAVLGLGNLGVILCFAQVKALRKPFNYIVIGMSVGNFVMSDVTSVMEMILVLRKFVAVGPGFCYVNVFLRTFSFGQSMLFIALMAVLRAWSGLTKTYTSLSLKKIIICVVAVYVLSLVWAGVWVKPSFNTTSICNGMPAPVNMTVLMIFLGVTIFLFLLTLLSYVALGTGIRCRRVQNTIVTGSKKSEILTLQAAITVSIVFIVGYFIPFMPAVISFPKFVPLYNLLHVFSVFNSLAYVQSAVAPYIYLGTNAHFRRAFKKSCKRVFCMYGNQVDPMSASNTEQTYPAPPSANLENKSQQEGTKGLPRVE